MLDTFKYLIGSPGASGYGSKSTAEQVTDASADLHQITAIITGTYAQSLPSDYNQFSLFLTDRVVFRIILGATSGIGAETARVLAKRGAKLVLPARSLKAAEDAKARIVSEFPGSKIIVMALDLSSLASVRSFVSDFESLRLPLNLLM